ncbi:Six-hairpin glycosidase [Clathrospora elynae]|uniref:Six-hairpin glycosidase n=1 Tax=Clathrospora elynae TaxID=706981 RepID=A0A6A5SE39_9PLEO|nr:Six-hairpin glycosidase [Clathrospora elynae]
MAHSIISRNQGILTSQTDVSALLQAGFTQKALYQVLQTYMYPNNTLTRAVNAYTAKSVDSVVPVVSNATRDTGYPLDRLSSGNALLRLYEETGEAGYKTALEALRTSIGLQTRNAQGGLLYYVYPGWSYLDGMYSFAPFLTGYAVDYAKKEKTDEEALDRAVEDVMLQLDLLWQHCHVEKSGLLVHGYDDGKTAVWANNSTGASPHVWGRSLGWYSMALVDTMEILSTTDNTSHVLPEKTQKARSYIQARFRELVPAVVAAVDAKTGAWWQVMDMPGREGNYVESSASAMFVYSILKGVRLGYLSGNETSRGTGNIDVATRAYEYMADTFVVHNGNGTLGWNGTVGVCSLNSSASYEYYVGRPIVYNSVLGSAAFVLASLEYERVEG